MNADEHDPWMTVGDVSRELHASEQAVRRWLRRKELVGTNFGGRMGWRVRRSALNAFIAKRTEGKATARTDRAVA
jgi:excisionase family DNA binding protein